jgi:hypothetical protein
MTTRLLIALALSCLLVVMLALWRARDARRTEVVAHYDFVLDQKDISAQYCTRQGLTAILYPDGFYRCVASTPPAVKWSVGPSRTSILPAQPTPRGGAE